MSGRVRTARKTWRCENAHACEYGNPAAANCRVTITPGERYTETEHDIDVAGGFGFSKACIACEPIADMVQA